MPTETDRAKCASDLIVVTSRIEQALKSDGLCHPERVILRSALNELDRVFEDWNERTTDLRRRGELS